MAAAGRKVGEGGGGSACRLSVGKSEGKRPFGRHRHRRKDNISVVIKKNRVMDFALDKSDLRLGTSGGAGSFGQGNDTWG